MGVCTKERKGGTTEVLMASPCTNSLGGESWSGAKRWVLLKIPRCDKNGVGEVKWP